MVARPVAAQTANRVGPVATYSSAYENNVLGLPESETDTYVGARSDRVRTLQAGVQLQKTIGRQLLSADLRASEVKYDRFALLDYQGRDAKAEWKWQAGNRLHGTASVKYQRSLMSFDDYHILERRLQSERAKHVEARWQLHPRWELVAAGTDGKISYDTDLLRARSRRERFVDAGLDYVTPVGNTAGVLVRRTVGTYPRSPELAVFPFDEDFEQGDVRFHANWQVAGKLHVHTDGGYVSRRHKTAGTRDFYGASARLDAGWAVTGKSVLNASLWRELGLVDDLVAYSVNKGASLRYGWSMTSKLQSHVDVSYETRDFPRTRVSAPGSTEGDMLRKATWSTEYNYAEQWQLRASLFRTLKNGRGAVTSFSRNGGAITLQYQFRQ